MTNLESLLRYIQEEKNTKLIPENLKEGVECLGVTGTYVTDPTTSEEYINSVNLLKDILGEDDVDAETLNKENATYFYITTTEADTEVSFLVSGIAGNVGVCDWAGEDTTTYTWTSSGRKTYSHTFANAGDYVIKLYTPEGSTTFSQIDIFGSGTPTMRRYVTKIISGNKR